MSCCIYYNFSNLYFFLKSKIFENCEILQAYFASETKRTKGRTQSSEGVAVRANALADARGPLQKTSQLVFDSVTIAFYPEAFKPSECYKFRFLV